EDGDGYETVQGGIEALLDVVGTQAGADGAFFDDLHRGGQRAGAQQEGNVGGFLCVHAAGNLNLPARDLAADHRCRYNLALALFEQHDGHAATDVVSGDIAEDACALGVEGKVDGGKLGLLVATRLGVLQVFTCQDDLAAQQQWTAVGVFEAFQAERHGASSQCRGGGGGIFHHADFQGRSTAQDLFGLCDVLNARQLDNDAVRALLLNDWLGHAQFVDPIVEGGDVLAQRVGLYRVDGLLGQLTAKGVVTARLARCSEGKVGQGATQFA